MPAAITTATIAITPIPIHKPSSPGSCSFSSTIVPFTSDASPVCSVGVPSPTNHCPPLGMKRSRGWALVLRALGIRAWQFIGARSGRRVRLSTSFRRPYSIRSSQALNGRWPTPSPTIRRPEVRVRTMVAFRAVLRYSNGQRHVWLL